MKPSRQLQAAASFVKRAADALETVSVRPFRASDTARRLPRTPGAGSAYSMPTPPMAASQDNTSAARALPPPPV